MAATRTFGRYQIRAELGRGGMATVYHASDPSFGRDVAIKVLPREFLHDTTFRARFEREARTIAALEHPAIVPVYDFGEQDDQPYLVMRYMSEGSLAERIAQGPIHLAEIIRVIGQLAPALDTAHLHGIIHRDLKPANILFDGEDNAYLSDFGIAKVAQETTSLTGGAGIIGTPAYMSPEQGRGQPLESRSDLYSLGVILFQMLSGRLPFVADTPIGLIYAHAHDPVPDILEVAPDLPPAFAAVVKQALAKDPADRYQTARELADALGGAAIGKRQTGALPTEPLTPVLPYDPTTYKISTEGAPSILASALSSPALDSHTNRTRNLFRWMWLGGGLVVAAGMVLGGIMIGNLIGGRAGEATPTSAPPVIATSPTSTGQPAVTEPAGAAATGSPDQPVTANKQWKPVIQVFSGVNMALVPAGCFMMGSDTGENDERPVHEFCFQAPFWIDVTEVTNAQYGPSGNWSGDNLPRENLSWMNARDFCESRGTRLPTEAEWEYAARGPDNLAYTWGNVFIPDNLIYEGNSGQHTWEVKSKPGNLSWVGAYDMVGNVWEWVNSWYAPYPYRIDDGREAADNPSGYEGRVVRGGSWGFYGGVANTTNRFGGAPVNRSPSFGFRCARSDEP